MHDIDEFLGSGHLWGITRLAGIDHVFTDVVLNDLRDKAIQGAAAGGGLLQDGGAFVVRINCALDGFELTAHSSDAIQ